MSTPDATPPTLGGRAVGVAAGATAATGAAAAVLAAVVAGADAVRGALLGAALVTGVLGFSSLVLLVVTRVAPALSLLVALTTYTLQVALMALVLLVVRTTPALASATDVDWVGGTVIAGVGVWLVVQVRTNLTTRTPTYDLPSGSGAR